MHRVAVYTAIIGDFDSLHPVVEQTGVKADFYCFSDQAPGGNGWRRVPVVRTAQHPRLQAKWFKLFPHELFPSGRLAPQYSGWNPFRHRYDYTLWIDGSIAIRSPEFVRTFVEAAAVGLALVKHPERDNITDEAAVSASMPKYQGQPVVEQAAAYVSAGLPAGVLYACGLIAQSVSSSEALRPMREAWWRECLAWTLQDQISFPYVCHERGVTPSVIDLDLWNNPLFQYIPHKTNL